MTAGEADPRTGSLILEEQRIELPGANTRKSRETWRREGAGERVLLTDGVERVDGRVGDGDERDAVGAHLHGDPDRPRGHGRPLAGSLDRGGGRWWGGETARERWEGNEEGGDVRKCFKLGRLERFFFYLEWRLGEMEMGRIEDLKEDDDGGRRAKDK